MFGVVVDGKGRRVDDEDEVGETGGHKEFEGSG